MPSQADEPSSFEILRPIMRAFSSEPAKAYVPPPAAEVLHGRRDSRDACGTRRTRECSSGAAHDRRAGAGARRPAAANRIARVTAADESRSGGDRTIASRDREPGRGPRHVLRGGGCGPHRRDDRSGIHRLLPQVAHAPGYGDFFRATQKRELRIERLAWNTSPGTATAKGEATVRAQYADRAPLDRRVDLQMEIVLRDGQARLRNLALFPDSP
jgi:hypothetical protein